jgi:hypothetical protein
LLILSAQYNTSDPTSFAYVSARDRWPVIITQGIDDVHRSAGASKDEEVLKEGKWVVSELARLKYELQHDRALTPLHDDGEPDVAEYNKELESLGEAKWHSVPWLFSECYLYRCVWVWSRPIETIAYNPRKARLEHLQTNPKMEIL